ncbi:MAG: hypothetical protein IPI73_30750 [Betaproteobacteria bacterium]|nr:hypothetical protein [Betaproteobacteria bacterium]
MPDPPTVSARRRLVAQLETFGQELLDRVVSTSLALVVGNGQQQAGRSW